MPGETVLPDTNHFLPTKVTVLQIVESPSTMGRIGLNKQRPRCIVFVLTFQNATIVDELFTFHRSGIMKPLSSEQSSPGSEFLSSSSAMSTTPVNSPRSTLPGKPPAEFPSNLPSALLGSPFHLHRKVSWGLFLAGAQVASKHAAATAANKQPQLRAVHRLSPLHSFMPSTTWMP